MKIKREKVESVVQYVEAVLDRISDWRGKTHVAPSSAPENATEVWFRGQGKSSHKLVPNAYRGNSDHDSMFTRFVAAGSGILSPPPVTDWDWYFTAQHYELHTRLLDWTESPLAALFFAVRGMLPDDAPLEVDASDPPAV